jgi:hypothetical protein
MSEVLLVLTVLPVVPVLAVGLVLLVCWLMRTVLATLRTEHSLGECAWHLRDTPCAFSLALRGVNYSGCTGSAGGQRYWTVATVAAHRAILGREAGMCSIVESRRLTTLSSASRLRSSSVAFVSCRFLHPTSNCEVSCGLSCRPPWQPSDDAMSLGAYRLPELGSGLAEWATQHATGPAVRTHCCKLCSCLLHRLWQRGCWPLRPWSLWYAKRRQRRMHHDHVARHDAGCRLQ